MPMRYELPQGNPDLELFKKLPAEEIWTHLTDEKAINNKDEEYNHCYRCDGWVKAPLIQDSVDDMGMMCGRRGETWNCARCGWEIHFFGMMS